MAKLTLKLLATGYRQPNERGNDLAGFTERSRGEVFDAIDQQEYDRLIAIGAAQDPDKALELEREELARRREVLEAQQADLDSQLAALQDPTELKGADLDAALTARDLSTDGRADEKRARLADAIAAEQA